MVDLNTLRQYVNIFETRKRQIDKAIDSYYLQEKLSKLGSADGAGGGDEPPSQEDLALQAGRQSWCQKIAQEATNGSWWDVYERIHETDEIWESIHEDNEPIALTDQTSHALLYFLNNILLALKDGQGQMQKVEYVCANQTHSETSFFYPTSRRMWREPYWSRKLERHGHDINPREKISSTTVLNEQIFDCITEWLNTATTHTATPMPEYYITAMTDNLSDFLEIGRDGTDKTVLREYMKPFMATDWEGIDSTARACVQHMWNVLNDLSQRFSALDDRLSHINSQRDYSTKNLLSYMFQVNIRAWRDSWGLEGAKQDVVSFSGIDGTYIPKCNHPTVLFSYEQIDAQPKTHMITEEIKGWCTVIAEAADTIEPWWEDYKDFYEFEFEKETLGFHAMMRLLRNILSPEAAMLEDAQKCIQELLSRETSREAFTEASREAFPTESDKEYYLNMMLRFLNDWDQRDNQLFAEYRHSGPWQRACIAHMWNVLASIRRHHQDQG